MYSRHVKNSTKLSSLIVRFMPLVSPVLYASVTFIFQESRCIFLSNPNDIFAFCLKLRVKLQHYNLLCSALTKSVNDHFTPKIQKKIRYLVYLCECKGWFMGQKHKQHLQLGLMISLQMH